MNNPKNHHYIPQSYLKNFAFRIKAKKSKTEHYVYVNFEGREFTTNVRNICSENYFYTIPNIDDASKNRIEKYYAEKIDFLYPEIYSLVTDDAISRITEKQRIMLLVGCLSLYFRTPAFNKTMQQHYEKLLDELRLYYYGYSEKSYTMFFNVRIDLKNLDYDMLKKEIVDEKKNIFLRDHLKVFNNYIDYRIDDGIGIIKIEDDSQFITSDNPVSICNITTGEFDDLFDLNNIIHLPINSKYMLSITPKADKSLKGSFTRISGNYIDAIIANSSTEQNREKWVIGSPDSIHTHFADQKKYNELVPENLKMLEDIKKRAQLMFEFDRFRVSQGGDMNDAVLNKFIEISKMEIMKDDPNCQRLLRQFKDKGLIKS